MKDTLPPSEAEARELLIERVRTELFGNLCHYRQRCINERDDAEQVIRFIDKLATLPPQDRSGDARELLAREYDAAGKPQWAALLRYSESDPTDRHVQAALRAIEAALGKAAWRFAARFWSRVDVRSDSECWPWRGSLSNGYPTMRIDGKTRRASQVAWELANEGPFPAELIALHHCDSPPCCNPAHVYPGTPAENMHDMVNRGRSANQQRTHCPRGHEYTPENTRVRMRGGAPRRSCRACQAIHVRNHRLKTRALKETPDG